MTMRITTKMIYEQGSTQINSLQASLNRTQNQLSTNRRVLAPSDDPVAASRALEVTQSQSINTQLVSNRTSAKNFLSQEELALQTVEGRMVDVQDLIVKAGNPGMSDADRLSLATELEGTLTDLLGAANTSDGAGGYLFSGYKSTTKPYTASSTGATYLGDQGQRDLQVGSTRSLATSDAGSRVFDSNLTGNGKFTTSAGAINYTNGGGGIISGGSVTDPTKLTGHQYSIAFTVAGADTSYIVTDTTLGVTVPDPAVATPYKDGEAIIFDGQQMEITGKPADGDTFGVAPSTKESVFTTVKSLIALLREPAAGEAGQARLTNGLNAAHDIMDAAYDNVLSVRAEVGSRLKEIDYLDSAGEDMDIQYASTLSALQDVDMVKAASLLSAQQLTLQAAQKSFTSTAGLSLFNYI